MSIQAILFDAYGTLFDVYSIGALAERLFPGKGQAIAELWRDKQIEYTRLRTLSNTYKPFWEITQDALVFCSRKLGIELTLDAQTQLMGQYAKLQPFAENLEVLQALKAKGMKLAILSNGNPEMLEAAVRAAGMDGLFTQVLSAHSVQKFKTAPEAYQLGPDMLGIAARDSLFVSSNGWDVCGAAWFGFQTFWVNRTGAPLEELGVSPQASGRSLNELLAYVGRGSAQ
jgi:2-haloacid dehalogenase